MTDATQEPGLDAAGLEAAAIALAIDRGSAGGLMREDFNAAHPRSLLGQAWHDAGNAIRAYEAHKSSSGAMEAHLLSEPVRRVSTSPAGTEAEEVPALSAYEAHRSGAGEPCGGCGETDPAKRCIGCLHPFASPAKAGELEEAHGYATRLLVALMEKHYPDRSPEWSPLPDLYGVLTQIDNLSTGLERSPAKKGPSDEAHRSGAGEPVADAGNDLLISDAVWLDGLAFVSAGEMASRLRAIAYRIRAALASPAKAGELEDDLIQITITGRDGVTRKAVADRKDGTIYEARAALSDSPASAACPAVTTLKPGCCSAISPCSHQRADPTSLCGVCLAALSQTAPASMNGTQGEVEPSEIVELHIVFQDDGGPMNLRFIEVETIDRKSVRAGTWMKRDDGYDVLALSVHRSDVLPQGESR